MNDIPEEMVEKALDAVAWGTWAGRDSLIRTALSAALAGRTVIDLPEMVTIPTFAGCTDSNPDNCACGESALCCTACGDQIEDGAHAYALTTPTCPWIDPDGEGQQWETTWWHDSCDLRAVSLKGDEQ